MFATATMSVKFLRTAAWLCAICSILGLSSAWGWPFELASHFEIEYTLFLAIVVLCYLPLLKQFVATKANIKLYEFGVFLACLVVSASTLIPYYLPSPMRANAAAKAESIKFLQINLNSKNRSFDKVAECINTLNPDVVSFEEYTPEWDAQMKAKLSDYKHGIAVPEPNNNFGIALFSRVPLQEPASLLNASTFGFPSIKAKFKLGQKSLNAIFTHTVPPVSKEVTEERDRMLSTLAKVRRETPGLFMLAGDLNCSPWSSVFPRFCKETGLLDSQMSFGIQPSWPTGLIFMRTPIDHFLLSPGLAVIERKIGPDVGSDHFPVFIELQEQSPSH